VARDGTCSIARAGAPSACSPRADPTAGKQLATAAFWRRRAWATGDLVRYRRSSIPITSSSGDRALAHASNTGVSVAFARTGAGARLKARLVVTISERGGRLP
jgi:hypothetical protein